jgi:ribonucleoside-diphosphate reductase alpha chain
MVLKNNKGTEDNRVRKLDYSIQISPSCSMKGLFKTAKLHFSPHTMFLDFMMLLEQTILTISIHQYEKDASIPKKSIKAQELILRPPQRTC